MEALSATYPETRADICTALRALEVNDVDETAPLYQLQYQLATASYARVLRYSSDSTISNADSIRYIEEKYAAMIASETDEQIQYDNFRQLVEYSKDANLAVFIANTCLAGIYAAMKLSSRLAYYGCHILLQILRQNDLSLPERSSSVRAVLDAMITYGNDTKAKDYYWAVNCEGIKFLHAVVTFSPANAALVGRETDVPGVVIAAKRILAGNLSSIEKCNVILMAI
jgi:hypothetical protein